RPLTGESTKETVKPLRGESRDVSAVPVKPVCIVIYFQHTALRAQSAPGFPCALFSRRGTTRCKTRAYRAAATRAHALLSLVLHMALAMDPSPQFLQCLGNPGEFLIDRPHLSLQRFDLRCGRGIERAD